VELHLFQTTTEHQSSHQAVGRNTRQVYDGHALQPAYAREGQESNVGDRAI
jgi:hypothetical protein